jgi:hypothetical protein
MKVGKDMTLMEKFWHLMIKFMLSVSIGIVLWLVILKVPVHADPLLYNVQPVLDNSSSHYGYFRYQFRPNQEQVMPFILTNNSSQTIKVNNTLNNGYNGINGSIAYNKWQAPNLLPSSLPHMTDMVMGSRQQVVLLRPHTSRRISFTIKMPSNLSSGDVLGGVTSRLQSDNSPSTMQYVTSILISHDVQQKMKLSKIHLMTANVNRDVLNLRIANFQNYLAYQMQMGLRLTDTRHHTIFNTHSKYSLVPNSINLYRTTLGNLNSGYYWLTLSFHVPHHQDRIIHQKIYVNGVSTILSVNKAPITFFSFRTLKTLLLSVSILMILGYIIFKFLHK